VVVAVPCGVSRHDILGLARLVLSGREYAELRRKIRPASSAQPDRASQRPSAGGNRESRRSDSKGLKRAPSSRHGLMPG